MNKKEDKIDFFQPLNDDNIILYEGNFHNFNLDKHLHEEYTISLIDNGIMNAFLKGFNHKLDSSSIITINPDEVHACSIANDLGYKHKSLYLHPKLIKEILKDNFNKELLLFNDFQFYDEALAFKLRYLMNRNSLNILSKLDWECETIDLVNEILVKSTKVNSFEEIKKFNPIVLKAKEYINDNYFENFCLDDLAKELSISKYYLLRLFKKYTYIPIHTYLMLRRVEKAKEFLRKGLNLVDTAHLCGFNDQSHLNRRFKISTGITPGRYKKFFN